MKSDGSNSDNLSPAAKGMLGDVRGIPARFNTYKNTYIKNSKLTGAEEILALTDAISSVSNLTSKLLHEFLPDSELNSLVGSIHQNTEQSLELIRTDHEKSKFLLNAAKIEALLKGFEISDLEKQGIKKFGLNENEAKKAIEASKQAVLELANTEVPRAEYVSRILEKSIEILNKDNALTSQQVESYRHFINQGEYSVKIDELGVVTPKPSKINDEERKVIADAAVKSTVTLEKELDEIIKKSDGLKKSGLGIGNAIKSISEFIQTIPAAISNSVQKLWSSIESWRKPQKTKFENTQNELQRNALIEQKKVSILPIKASNTPKIKKDTSKDITGRVIKG